MYRVYALIVLYVCSGKGQPIKHLWKAFVTAKNSIIYKAQYLHEGNYSLLLGCLVILFA